ncbi:hypothetical protein [Bauldia litoralis]|uniref:hypothetical protein n=1 Tax=Bauldia litoralis TaxID=665467 RepID=UPI0032656699
MKLTRRGIFALFPGAAMGGKKAMAEAAEKLALGDGMPVPPAGPYTRDAPWATKQLKYLASKAGRQDKWDATQVNRFDPDLAVQHSRSLSSKFAEQKRRNFKRNYEADKTYFERVISGFFDN